MRLGSEKTPRRKSYPLLVVLALVMAILPTTVTLAQGGAERAGLYVTGATLNRESNKTSKDPLQAGERLDFAFTWDASAYAGTADAPQPGDTITVALPAWARFHNATVDMKNDSGEAVATCVQTPDKVVCTFTDFVKNKTGLKGGFQSSLWLEETQQINPTSFQVGPVGVKVDLKNIVDQDQLDKGIIKGQSQLVVDHLNDSQSKTGYFNGVQGDSNGKALISWNVIVQGSGGSVTVRDEFLGSQEPAQLRGKNLTVRYRDRVAEGTVGGSWNLTTDSPQGTAHELAEEQYVVAWTQENGNSVATVTIPRTEKEKVYRVQFLTQVEPDFYQNGDVISNTVTINGVEVTGKATARNTIRAYAEGVQGKGSIYIFKNVAGLKESEIPADFRATFQADITYPDGHHEVREVVAKVGVDPAGAGLLENLPTGTKVRITEKNPYAVPGFSFSKVAFGEGKMGSLVPKADVEISPDATAVVATVRNAGVTEIAASNTYTRKTRTFSITKVVEGLPQNHPALSSQSFDVELSWVDPDSGEKDSVTVGMSDGNKEVFPSVPVGTKVTIREQLPANTPELAWRTPRYTSQIAGAVVDNGDGSASMTIPAGHETVDVEVLLTNTAELTPEPTPTPSVTPEPSPSVSPVPTPSSEMPVPPEPSPSETPRQTPKTPVVVETPDVSGKSSSAQAKPSRSKLAYTGAGVVALGGFAVVLSGVGVFLLRQRRRG